MNNTLFKGDYLHRGNFVFEQSVNSSVYVDKTDMIASLNEVVNTPQKYVCFSRPRRFGKTTDANMIAAYYDISYDSRFLFKNHKLGQLSGWDRYLNAFYVIQTDIADIMCTSRSPEEALDKLENGIVSELRRTFLGIIDPSCVSVADALSSVNNSTQAQFVIILDEWDVFFREESTNDHLHKRYISLLRSLFTGDRSNSFCALAYITGILPIIRYNGESAINTFQEFTMLSPGRMANYTGFTEEDIQKLCQTHGADVRDLKDWYDGYIFSNFSHNSHINHINHINHIYEADSIVKAVLNDDCRNYWFETSGYSSLASYITRDYDGLRKSIIELVGGVRQHLDPSSFQNDLTTIATKEDILTVLIHLGYLNYDDTSEEVFIPNREVLDCFKKTLNRTTWTGLNEAIESSSQLLSDLIKGNSDKVAAGVEKCHRQNTSIKDYNDEKALSAVISIAFYAAQDKYVFEREVPAGEGFADIILRPKWNVVSPPIVIELKWQDSAETAIAQIKRKKYPEALRDYSGMIILAGISYKKRGCIMKKHLCTIEKIFVNVKDMGQ